MLENKKDKYSNRFKEIIEKNSKNLNEIFETNSKIKNILNRLDYSNHNSYHSYNKIDIGLIDYNTDFYQKCQVTIQTVNKFLDFLLTQ